jgi:hypothetical protein
MGGQLLMRARPISAKPVDVVAERSAPPDCSPGSFGFPVLPVGIERAKYQM